MGTRWSLHVSNELAAAIDALAEAQGESRSQMVETLLREHEWVQRQVEAGREVAPPGGSDPGPSGPRRGVRTDARVDL